MRGKFPFRLFSDCPVFWMYHRPGEWKYDFFAFPTVLFCFVFFHFLAKFSSLSNKTSNFHEGIFFKAFFMHFKLIIAHYSPVNTYRLRYQRNK